MTTQLHLDPSHLEPAVLTPPVSKSDAQRAMVLAHLTGPWPLPGLEHEPEHFLPADVRVLRRGLLALREPPGVVRSLDCADGGAPFRFLVTQAAVTPGAHVLLSGTARLGERPHGPLFTSLGETLGPSGLELSEGNPWPVEIKAPYTSTQPVFRVRGAQSSQYASSLLLGCAALYLREQRPWSVELVGPLTSLGYLELTVAWMRRFGFKVEELPGRLTVSGWQAPAEAPSLPGDWSSLGYLLLISWRTGGQAERVDLQSAHPDQALLRVVEPVGLRAEPGPHGRLRLVGKPTRGLEASGQECPDLLPTLAALACVLPGPSTLTHVGVLRLKESDRLEGIRTLVAAYGGSTSLQGETLTVHPPPAPPARFSMDSRGDHRLAMTAATLSLLSGAPLTLSQPECVEKSFPSFWQQVEHTGARLSWTRPPG